MELYQIDLLTLNETDVVSTEKNNEQEGSLLTIENPQDKNTYEFLKTEKEIEQDDLSASLETTKKEKKPAIRIPFGFFSHVQQNRTKYIY